MTGPARRWLGALALGVLGTVLVPAALVQGLNLGLIREGRRAKREVALTFDDGPDPVTTPQVLDALKAAGGRATFFLLADRAEAHPALVRRIRAEGHEIGAHAVRHLHGWRRAPLDALRDPGEAARRIAAVAGGPVRLHRPPHGAYTVFTVLGQRRAGLQGVHWSLEGQDWQAGRSPAQVRARLERRIVPGAVVVLHDAGPGGRTTAALLPELLARLKARGYTVNPVSDLDGATPVGRAALKRRAILALDAAYDRVERVRMVGDRADNLFRVNRVAFPHAGLAWPDGTPIPAGTPALEFHVNNPQLVDLGPRAAVRAAPADFRELARELLDRPEYREAQLVFCVSSLGPLLSLVGFTNVPLPPGTGRRLRGWANVLRRAYGSAPDAPAPVLSVLSREAFLRRYGPRAG